MQRVMDTKTLREEGCIKQCIYLETATAYSPTYMCDIDIYICTAPENERKKDSNGFCQAPTTTKEE